MTESLYQSYKYLLICILYTKIFIDRISDTIQPTHFFPPSSAGPDGLGCFFQNDIKAAFATKELETRQAMMYNASKANLQPFQGPGTRPPVLA